MLWDNSHNKWCKFFIFFLYNAVFISLIVVLILDGEKLSSHHLHGPYFTSCCMYLEDYLIQPAKLLKKQYGGVYFGYIALHIERRFNKNSLLRCYFLVFLPAGYPNMPSFC